MGTGQAASELPTVELMDALGLAQQGRRLSIKKTGQIWRLSLSDGVLQVTDHLRGTYCLRPVDPTSFDPEGPFYATTQFVFSRTDAGSAWSLVSRWHEPENRGQLEFERVELVEPRAEQLGEYAGEYVGDELPATYRFAVRDGAPCGYESTAGVGNH